MYELPCDPRGCSLVHGNQVVSDSRHVGFGEISLQGVSENLTWMRRSLAKLWETSSPTIG